MFYTTQEHHGGCYLEFQFCTSDVPVKNGKTDFTLVEHWAEDSIVISDEDFIKLYEAHKSLLACALFPNGKIGFDLCGINYYNNEKTVNMYNALSKEKNDAYGLLLPWLKNAAEQGRGFYICGL